MTVPIVGAGSDGLVLTHMLNTTGIDAVVNERESSRDAGGQGGTLDTHSGGGRYAKPG